MLDIPAVYPLHPRACVVGLDWKRLHLGFAKSANALSPASREGEEPVEQELPDGRQHGRAELDRVGLEDLGDRVDDRGRVELPVARADEARERRVGLHAAAEAAALAQLDDAGGVLARRVVPGLGDVGGDAEPRGGERVVVERRCPVVLVDHRREMRAERAL